jgi:hypothetical protein
MEDEDLILETIDKSQIMLDQYHSMWEEYQKALKDIENAVNNNPYIKDVKQLENYALELRNKTNIDIIIIFTSIEKLVRYGRKIEDIKKIIDTSAIMAKKVIIPFNDAVEFLNNSYSCKIDILGEFYPELKGMPVEKLGIGEAVDFIYNKINET